MMTKNMKIAKNSKGYMWSLRCGAISVIILHLSIFKLLWNGKTRNEKILPVYVFNLMLSKIKGEKTGLATDKITFLTSTYGVS